MPNAISEEFKSKTQYFKGVITRVECYHHKMFGYLNVFVANNGESEWFVAREVMETIGYGVKNTGKILSRTVRIDEIRKIVPPYKSLVKLPYKITSSGLYLISSLGISDLIVNAHISHYNEYKLWVAEILNQIRLIETCKQSLLENVCETQEIDNNYLLRLINLSYFLIFRKTYSEMDTKLSYNENIRPFEFAYKLGGNKLIDILNNNIKFILIQMQVHNNASLSSLEEWVYNSYPFNHTNHTYN